MVRWVETVLTSARTPPHSTKNPVRRRDGERASPITTHCLAIEGWSPRCTSEVHADLLPPHLLLPEPDSRTKISGAADAAVWAGAGESSPCGTTDSGTVDHWRRRFPSATGVRDSSANTWSRLGGRPASPGAADAPSSRYLSPSEDHRGQRHFGELDGTLRPIGTASAGNGDCGDPSAFPVGGDPSAMRTPMAAMTKAGDRVGDAAATGGCGGGGELPLCGEGEGARRRAAMTTTTAPAASLREPPSKAGSVASADTSDSAHTADSTQPPPSPLQGAMDEPSVPALASASVSAFRQASSMQAAVAAFAASDHLWADAWRKMRGTRWRRTRSTIGARKGAGAGGGPSCVGLRTLPSLSRKCPRPSVVLRLRPSGASGS